MTRSVQYKGNKITPELHIGLPPTSLKLSPDSFPKWIGIFGNSLDMRRGKKECTWNLVNYISKLSNISTFLQYPPSFGLVSSPSAFMAELKCIQWAVEGDKREGRSSEYFSSNHETEINPPLAFMMRPKYVKTTRWRLSSNCFDLQISWCWYIIELKGDIFFLDYCC